MNDKQERQAAVRQIVRQRAVASQEELVELLEKRGVSATQASVSRDLRELGLVKLDGRYVLPERLVNGSLASAPPPWAELVHGVRCVGANLLVVRTAAGMASAVAVEFDRLQLEEVEGTIAGDDTIFVAVRSRAAQGRVMAALRPRPVPAP